MPAQIPVWVNAYGGIPYVDLGRDRAGSDCWGLFKLIYAERYQIELPNFAAYQGTSTVADVRDIAGLINGWIDEGDWLAVDWHDPVTNAVRWSNLREGDGVLLRVRGQPGHISLLVTPRVMLHTVHNEYSHPEELDSPRWAYRILDIRRHRRLADRIT